MNHKYLASITKQVRSQFVVPLELLILGTSIIQGQSVLAEWVTIATQNTPIYGLTYARNLAVDVNRNVYVTEDGEPSTYTVFSASGAGQMIVTNNSTGTYQWPTGIDVADDGTVVVAIRTGNGNGSIQFFDNNGNFISSFSVDDY